MSLDELPVRARRAKHRAVHRKFYQKAARVKLKRAGRPRLRSTMRPRSDRAGLGKPLIVTVPGEFLEQVVEANRVLANRSPNGVLFLPDECSLPTDPAPRSYDQIPVGGGWPR